MPKDTKSPTFELFDGCKTTVGQRLQSPHRHHSTYHLYEIISFLCILWPNIHSNSNNTHTNHIHLLFWCYTLADVRLARHARVG